MYQLNVVPRLRACLDIKSTPNPLHELRSLHRTHFSLHLSISTSTNQEEHHLFA